jgi:hypothetical protein
MGAAWTAERKTGRSSPKNKRAVQTRTKNKSEEPYVNERKDEGSSSFEVRNVEVTLCWRKGREKKAGAA